MSTAPSPGKSPSPAAPAPSTNSTSPPSPPSPTAPPPSTPSAPPPSTPSAPPPSNTTAPPPSTPSSPPPTTPSAPPPTSPATPSPPPPTAPPPSTNTTSPPPPSSPPSSSKSPPPPPTKTPPTPSPPPPPRSAHTPPSPPPPPSNSTSPNSSPPSNGGVSTEVVVGIAIGGVAILIVLSLLFICCRKKKRRSNDDGYYVPPPPPTSNPPKVGTNGAYGGQQQYQLQQNNPPPPNHYMAAIPNQNHPPPGGSRPPYSPTETPRPPQPPPFMNSSGGSGSNYSGSENPQQPPSPTLSLGFSKSIFSYEELARATDGFSDANLLGQGGFGYVHKGVLPNGKEVAVKQLKVGSGQGEREFQAEIEIISRVHHKHLVSLVGYCMAGTERLLVYEFVPNNTMEFHLHASGRPVMEWSTRLKIALGAAKGLAYLHEDCHPKIIHRDIKAANILLDFKFEAKVADFGLAKFTSDTNTHVSTRVMGTFGYLAPEYASSGKLTEKSDVFSYGVMLLELITGRRPVDSTQTYMDDSLVDWARPLLTRALEDGNFSTLADPRLQGNYDLNEMARMVNSAAACMVRSLEEDASLSDINDGMRPGQSSLYSSNGSSDYDTFQYNEDMKKFRKMALGTNTTSNVSSEYSGGAPTSEYGLNPSGSSSEGQATREFEMGKMSRKKTQFGL
ncbi:hypothetical protein ACFE04_013548 [Oxalis oulophora]